MARFSPAWVGQLDQALRRTGLTSVSAIVVEHTVVDDGEELAWHVAVDAEGATAAVGPAPVGSHHPPVVRLRTGHATAVDLARGVDAARTAFMRGDLQVGGDTTALVTARPLLEELARAIGGLPNDDGQP